MSHNSTINDHKTKDFSNKIRHFFYKHLSQHPEFNENGFKDHICKRLGVSRKMLHNWMSNISQPSLEETKKIASILDKSIDDLIN